MDSNTPEVSNPPPEEMVRKQKTLLSDDKGKILIEKTWMEIGGKRRGATALEVNDTLGNLVWYGRIDGRGGGLINSDVDSVVTKEKDGLPTEIIQTEEGVSADFQILAKDLPSALIELDQNKIELMWNSETKQLTRAVRSKVIRYTTEGEIYSFVEEERFLYDNNGRLVKRIVASMEGEKIQTKRVEEFEYSEIPNESGLQLQIAKDFRFDSSAKKHSLFLVHGRVVDPIGPNRKWLATGQFANTESHSILGGKVNFVQESMGNTLNLYTKDWDVKDRLDLLPEQLNIESFSPKQIQIMD